MNRFEDIANDSADDSVSTADPFSHADPLETFDPDFADYLRDRRLIHPSSADSDRTPRVDSDGLDDVDRAQLHKVCEQFEVAWESNAEEPRIEEHIPEDVTDALQYVMVRQLVMCDIANREKRDNSLSPDEYLNRLSDCREAVESVLTERSSKVPRGYGSLTLPTDGNKADGDRSPPRHANDPETRYRPISAYKRGGFGEIFRAYDEELKRIVAVKEILPKHLEDDRYKEKFVFEASVTGSLEHPGIVPVYGLGHYKDEEPYYAMRFIRGTSFREKIKSFHKRNPSPTADTFLGQEIRDLLGRLIASCNALHYAHRKRVLHRDIKPDNIMLGKYGETLVVDWGLAQLIAKDRSQKNADYQDVTESIEIKLSGRSSQGVAGTPMYMSPEQTIGQNDQLDARTDVYSLGGVLFNLITGEHPIEGKNSTEIVDNVRLGKVKKLNSLVPDAPKALASICRKAMELDPNDRYKSAVDFAKDIELWLGDEPVAAHNETWTESAGRWLRRHRSWTFSIAAALVLVTIAAAVSTVFISRARANERAAKIEAIELYGQSRSTIDTWLVESSDTLQYFPETQAVRTRLLVLATEYYETLTERNNEDPGLELERGRALLKLADLQHQQQDLAGAKTRYNEALRLFQRNVGDRALAHTYRALQAETYRRIGLSYAEENDFAAAKQEYQRAIGLLETLTAERDDPHAFRVLAMVQKNIGELAALLGESDSSIQHLEDSLRAFQSLGPNNDDEIRHDVARTHVLLGRAHAFSGNNQKADGEFGQGIEVLRTLVEEEPDHPKYLDGLASAHVSRANSFRARGLQQRMIDSLELAASQYRVLRIATPGVLRYKQNLVISLVDLGLVLHDDDLSAKAIGHLQEARQLADELVSFYPQVPDYREARAACYDGLGQVLLDTNEDPAEAIPLLDVAVTEFERLQQSYADHPAYLERLAIATSHYAQALARSDKIDEAIARFESSLELVQQLIDDSPGVSRYKNVEAQVHYRYALMLRGRDDARAESRFASARDLWLALAESGAASYAHNSAWLLATCPAESVRDTGLAVKFAEQATELAPENARFCTTSAIALVLAGDIDRADRQINRARELRAKLVARDLFVLAMIQARQGQTRGAELTFERANESFKANQPYHADLRQLQRIAERIVTGLEE